MPYTYANHGYSWEFVFACRNMIYLINFGNYLYKYLHCMCSDLFWWPRRFIQNKNLPFLAAMEVATPSIAADTTSRHNASRMMITVTPSHHIPQAITIHDTLHVTYHDDIVRGSRLSILDIICAPRLWPDTLRVKNYLVYFELLFLYHVCFTVRRWSLEYQGICKKKNKTLIEIFPSESVNRTF